MPLAVDHELLYSFADDVQPYLIKELGLSKEGASAICLAYLAEDPSVVSEREELLIKEKRLLDVQAQLRNFGV